MGASFFSRYWFWGLLCLPALIILGGYGLGIGVEEGMSLEEALLTPTGEWSARLMIIALMITPLRAVWPRSMTLLWLTPQRRPIGVAAFLYAAWHLWLYLIYAGDFEAYWFDLEAPGIWTGWLAILLMLPPFIISNDRLQRALRRNWKRIQRLVYAAALLTLFHWILIHDHTGAAIAHFVPLAILELIRVGKWIGRRKPKSAAPSPN